MRDVGPGHREVPVHVQVAPGPVATAERLVGEPGRSHDRPVQPARAHDLLHGDEVGKDVLQEQPADWLEDIAHAGPLAFVERPGATDHDEASRARSVHRRDDAPGAVGADRGRCPPVAAPDCGDDGVAAGDRFDDRRGIHHVRNYDVEAGSVVAEA